MNREWIFLAYWPQVETPNVVRAIGATVGDAEATLRQELPGMDVFVNIGYVMPDSGPQTVSRGAW